ncbi:glucokinase [Shouchella clausii]|uniref:ROK family glucokinase n=1 Tax=Shouchella clausii TaxID=79880 RepID=UPI000791B4CA|nr:ROK family glucokinase [Shouchella clausii]KKI86261.1 glucokinase [Shouchella clausii]MDO7268466.1 ROK family glucokinase [Shouchella clausii]MDO7282981.1 ROK family glucokinase [Shouchella clausii]MDO7288346.1 ROK family glucokinase [Shouchella clausii]MDO7303078.1 ROK family glucokinase [Shouchella clausii]
MTEDYYAGIDIGGTTVKLAFLTETGELKDKWEIPTDVSENGKHIVDQIAASIQSRLPQHATLLGAGVGAPGFIEMETGFIHHAVNIGWRNYPLREELERVLGVVVRVDNDANLAALGEKWRGAGDGAEEELFITLGTGVGGGIITRGQILHGASGMGGEIGHITVIPEGGAPCNCGKTGCLETVSSATGILRMAKEKLTTNKDSALHCFEEGALTTKDIFDAAKAGDALAKDVVSEATFHLGFAIANLANTLNPSKIIIGGGVSKAKESLLAPLRLVFKQFALPRVSESAEIKLAHLGNDAGIYGAVWLAIQAKATQEEEMLGKSE